MHILASQNEGRDGETNEIEDSQETENAADEDDDAAVAFHVVTEFCDGSPRDFLNGWLEFFLIFYLEQFFDNFTRRDETNEQEKRGRGGEEGWNCKSIRPESG